MREAELLVELYSFKQCSLSVTDFFTQLKVIWEGIRQLPSHTGMSMPCEMYL